MFRFLRDLSLGAKIATLGAGSVLVAAFVLVGLAAWQSMEYNALARGEVNALIDAGLDGIAQGAYNLVQTEDRAVQQQVNDNLNVARHILAEAGGVSLTPNPVDWTAKNQFTGESVAIQLPQMTVGGEWLGQNTDPAIATNAVDDVTRLVGDTATIFQRMNAEGDMLRVATTVQTASGKRAIGTYIPAIEPQGTPNPVITAILRGDTYHGRAYVVDAWYLTAYEAITDSAGDIVGMLYVGVKQSSVESRVREAILRTKVGQTGYLYVLGSQGERRGRYVISQRGERDGEDVWDSRDSDGHYVIQTIIAEATALAPGELATVRYPWQNPGEPAPRWKIARLAYYAPWDWVIGASVYEDELETYWATLAAGRARMTRVMVVVGLGITLLIGFVGVWAARTIARPVRQMTRAAQTVIQGDLSQVVEVHSRDEIGTLAATFNAMTHELKRTLESLHQTGQQLEQRIQDLHASEQKYRQIVETSQEGITVLDEEGRFTFVNQYLASLLGYTPQELLGRPVRDFMIPEELADHDERVRQRRIGIAERYERRYRSRDGGVIVTQTSATPLLDDAGRFRGSLAMIMETTDRHQAEAELRRSRNMLAHVLNSIPQCVFWKDRDGVYLGCNDEFARKIGLASAADIVGRTDFDLPWAHEEAESYRTTDQDIVATGIPRQHIIEPVQQADGTRLWVDTAKVPLLDERGHIYGILGVFDDITERRRAEEALRDSERRLRSLIQASPMGLFIYRLRDDDRLVLVDSNPAADRMTGANNRSQCGMTLEEAFPGLAASEIQERYLRAARDGTPWQTTRFEYADRAIAGVFEMYVFQTAPNEMAVQFLEVTPLARAEHELRESRQQLELALQGGELAFWDWHLPTDTVVYGDMWAQLLGYERDEIEPTSEFLKRHVHPDDWPMLRTRLMDHIEGRCPIYECEHRLRTRAGTYRWVLVRGKVVERDAEGHALRATGVTSDITARKLAEEERTRLIEILETTSDVVSMATLDARITYMNAAGRQLLGWETAEELGERTIADAHPPATYEFLRNTAMPMAIAQGVWQGDSALAASDGHEIPVSQVILAHRNPAGAVEYLSTIMRDMTERKQAELELERSKAFLETLIEHLPVGVMAGEPPDCGLSLVNREAERIVGVSRDRLCDVDGRHPEQLGFEVCRSDGTTCPIEEVPLPKAVWQGVETHNAEMLLRGADGVERTILCNAAPVRGPDGTTHRGVVSFLDITERKRAEAERDQFELQLRQAQKLEAIGQLAGGVAHDFNNILTAIFGNVELALGDLEQQFPTAYRAIDGMRQIEKSAERAAHLTRQLLAFSRRQVIRPEVLNINATLRDMEKMLRRLITENVKLHIHCDPDLQPVKIDPGQLEQVVVNLVVNARDAMPDGGQLTLETQNIVFDEKHVATHSEVQPGSYALLAVGDTGHGMDRATLERIFEPFFTTKPVGQGTGLGLSTVYGIIRQAGGSVAVYSEPEHGTTFKVYLPVSHDANTRVVREADTTPLPTGVETLLICEDDPTVRELTALMLREAGYTVLVAASPHEALRLAATTTDPLDLLITDVIMPDMNGRKLSDALTHMHPSVRTLFVSGYTSNVIAHHGVLEQNVEFLEKPFSRRRLLRCVREVLERVQTRHDEA